LNYLGLMNHSKTSNFFSRSVLGSATHPLNQFKNYFDETLVEYFGYVKKNIKISKDLQKINMHFNLTHNLKGDDFELDYSFAKQKKSFSLLKSVVTAIPCREVAVVGPSLIIPYEIDSSDSISKFASLLPENTINLTNLVRLWLGKSYDPSTRWYVICETSSGYFKAIEILGITRDSRIKIPIKSGLISFFEKLDVINKVLEHKILENQYILYSANISMYLGLNKDREDFCLSLGDKLYFFDKSNDNTTNDCIASSEFCRIHKFFDSNDFLFDEINDFTAIKDFVAKDMPSSSLSRLKTRRAHAKTLLFSDIRKNPSVLVELEEIEVDSVLFKLGDLQYFPIVKWDMNAERVKELRRISTDATKQLLETDNQLRGARTDDERLKINGEKAKIRQLTPDEERELNVLLSSQYPDEFFDCIFKNNPGTSGSRRSGSDIWNYMLKPITDKETTGKQVRGKKALPHVDSIILKPKLMFQSHSEKINVIQSYTVNVHFTYYSKKYSLLFDSLKMYELRDSKNDLIALEDADIYGAGEMQHFWPVPECICFEVKSVAFKPFETSRDQESSFFAQKEAFLFDNQHKLMHIFILVNNVDSQKAMFNDVLPAPLSTMLYSACILRFSTLGSEGFRYEKSGLVGIDKGFLINSEVFQQFSLGVDDVLIIPNYKSSAFQINLRQRNVGIFGEKFERLIIGFDSTKSDELVSVFAIFQPLGKQVKVLIPVNVPNYYEVWVVDDAAENIDGLSTWTIDGLRRHLSEGKKGKLEPKERLVKANLEDYVQTVFNDAPKSRHLNSDLNRGVFQCNSPQTIQLVTGNDEEGRIQTQTKKIDLLTMFESFGFDMLDFNFLNDFITEMFTIIYQETGLNTTGLNMTEFQGKNVYNLKLYLGLLVLESIKRMYFDPELIEKKRVSGIQVYMVLPSEPHFVQLEDNITFESFSMFEDPHVIDISDRIYLIFDINGKTVFSEVFSGKMQNSIKPFEKELTDKLRPTKIELLRKENVQVPDVRIHYKVTNDTDIAMAFFNQKGVLITLANGNSNNVSLPKDSRFIEVLEVKVSEIKEFSYTWDVFKGKDGSVYSKLELAKTDRSMYNTADYQHVAIAIPILASLPDSLVNVKEIKEIIKNKEEGAEAILFYFPQTVSKQLIENIIKNCSEFVKDFKVEDFDVHISDIDYESLKITKLTISNLDIVRTQKFYEVFTLRADYFIQKYKIIPIAFEQDLIPYISDADPVAIMASAPVSFVQNVLNYAEFLAGDGLPHRVFAKFHDDNIFKNAFVDIRGNIDLPHSIYATTSNERQIDPNMRDFVTDPVKKNILKGLSNLFGNMLLPYRNINGHDITLSIKMNLPDVRTMVAEMVTLIGGYESELTDEAQAPIKVVFDDMRKNNDKYSFKFSYPVGANFEARTIESVIDLCYLDVLAPYSNCGSQPKIASQDIIFEASRPFDSLIPLTFDNQRQLHFYGKFSPNDSRFYVDDENFKEINNLAIINGKRMRQILSTIRPLTDELDFGVIFSKASILGKLYPNTRLFYQIMKDFEYFMRNGMYFLSNLTDFGRLLVHVLRICANAYSIDFVDFLSLDLTFDHKEFNAAPLVSATWLIDRNEVQQNPFKIFPKKMVGSWALTNPDVLANKGLGRYNPDNKEFFQKKLLKPTIFFILRRNLNAQAIIKDISMFEKYDSVVAIASKGSIDTYDFMRASYAGFINDLSLSHVDDFFKKEEMTSIESEQIKMINGLDFTQIRALSPITIFAKGEYVCVSNDIEKKEYNIFAQVSQINKNRFNTLSYINEVMYAKIGFVVQSIKEAFKGYILRVGNEFLIYNLRNDDRIDKMDYYCLFKPTAKETDINKDIKQMNLRKIINVYYFILNTPEIPDSPFVFGISQGTKLRVAVTDGFHDIEVTDIVELPKMETIEKGVDSWEKVPKLSIITELNSESTNRTMEATGKIDSLYITADKQRFQFVAASKRYYCVVNQPYFKYGILKEINKEKSSDEVKASEWAIYDNLGMFFNKNDDETFVIFLGKDKPCEMQTNELDVTSVNSQFNFCKVSPDSTKVMLQLKDSQDEPREIKDLQDILVGYKNSLDELRKIKNKTEREQSTAILKIKQIQNEINKVLTSINETESAIQSLRSNSRASFLLTVGDKIKVRTRTISGEFILDKLAPNMPPFDEVLLDLTTITRKVKGSFGVKSQRRPLVNVIIKSSDLIPNASVQEEFDFLKRLLSQPGNSPITIANLPARSMNLLYLIVRFAKRAIQSNLLFQLITEYSTNFNKDYQKFERKILHEQDLSKSFVDNFIPTRILPYDKDHWADARADFLAFASKYPVISQAKSEYEELLMLFDTYNIFYDNSDNSFWKFIKLRTYESSNVSTMKNHHLPGLLNQEFNVVLDSLFTKDMIKLPVECPDTFLVPLQNELVDFLAKHDLKDDLLREKVYCGEMGVNFAFLEGDKRQISLDILGFQEGNDFIQWILSYLGFKVNCELKVDSNTPSQVIKVFMEELPAIIDIMSYLLVDVANLRKKIRYLNDDQYFRIYMNCLFPIIHETETYPIFIKVFTDFTKMINEIDPNVLVEMGKVNFGDDALYYFQLKQSGNWLKALFFTLIRLTKSWFPERLGVEIKPLTVEIWGNFIGSLKIRQASKFIEEIPMEEEGQIVENTPNVLGDFPKIAKSMQVNQTDEFPLTLIKIYGSKASRPSEYDDGDVLGFFTLLQPLLTKVIMNLVSKGAVSYNSFKMSLNEKTRPVLFELEIKFVGWQIRIPKLGSPARIFNTVLDSIGSGSLNLNNVNVNESINDLIQSIVG